MCRLLYDYICNELVKIGCKVLCGFSSYFVFEVLKASASYFSRGAVKIFSNRFLLRTLILTTVCSDKSILL